MGLGYLLLVYSVVLAADPCYFPHTNEVLELSQLRACFDSIPLDKNGVGYPTIDTLLKLNDMYVFNEMAKEPIAPYDVPTNAYKIPHIDVKRELQAIRDNMDSYTTDFDFHDAVSAVYLKLKDPHTRYDKPQGYSFMRVVLPLTVSAAYRNRVLEYTLTELPPEYQFVTWEYRKKLREQGINIDQFIDQRILSINGVPVAEAMQRFADDVVYISKNPHARLNAALDTDFYIRSLKSFGWPGRTGTTLDTEVLSIEFYDKSTLELPFLAYVTTEIRGVTDLKAHIMDTHTDTESDSSVTRKRRATPLARFLDDTMEASTRATTQPTRTFSTATDGEDEYYIDADHQGVDITLYSLYKNTKQVGYLLNIPTFAPESPKQYVDDFEAAMSILDNTHVTDPFLIVNVARNGGGYVTLGYRTLHVLAPYINPLYGNYTIRKSAYAEFYSSRGNFSTQNRYRLSDWMRYKNNAWYTGETEHILYMTGHDEALSGIYTFDLAYDEVDFKEDFERLVNIKTPKFLQESGNSRLVFVTDGTCGSTCACFAKRAREAHMGVWMGMGGNPSLRRIRNESDSENLLVDMDVASFAGGSVMDSQYVFDDSFAPQYNTHIGLTKLPTTALHRWAFEQIFSWNWSQPFDSVKTPLEYVNNPVDDYINYWPAGGSRYMDHNTYLNLAVEAYKKASSICYPFQMKTSRYCESVGGGIYANPCDLQSNRYNEDICSFYSCIDGYMLTEAGICVKQPEKWDQPVSALETGIYIGLAVILVLLIGSLTGYFIFRCVKYSQHVKKCKAEGTWQRVPSVVERLREFANRRKMKKADKKGESASKVEEEGLTSSPRDTAEI